jgi:hypothetical protein
MNERHHTQTRAESKVSNGWKNPAPFFRTLEKTSRAFRLFTEVRFYL